MSERTKAFSSEHPWFKRKKKEKTADEQEVEQVKAEQEEENLQTAEVCEETENGPEVREVAVEEEE